MKTALITGVAGQDGSYLAEFLLEKGYRVHGMARRVEGGAIWRIAHLLPGEEEADRRFFLHEGDILDAGFLRRLIDETAPDEIYNLAGQSHVGLSFQQPARTLEIVATGAVRVLEALHAHGSTGGRHVRFYQAGSSEMFGESPPPQTEDTPFRPRSPYGAAKLAAHNATAIYRDAYGLFACNGILFNHESPRRGEHFVTRKVTLAAARIAAGMQTGLALGDLSVRRDWGHAADYVRAMWLMLQQDTPEDYVIATGRSHTIGEVLEIAFGQAGLDWRRHVVSDPACRRPLEVDHLCGDAGKAVRRLGWRPAIGFEALIAEMAASDRARHGLRAVQPARPRLTA